MTNKRRAVPGVHPYDGPAGGWGALKATAIAVRTQMDAFEAPATLLRTNQPDGFDCPGCACRDLGGDHQTGDARIPRGKYRFFPAGKKRF